MRGKDVCALFCVILLTPLTGSIEPSARLPNEGAHQILLHGHLTDAPEQNPVTWAEELPWWLTTTLDSDRNGIHDSLDDAIGNVNVGLSYSRPVNDADIARLSILGHEVRVAVPSVDALLIGEVEASEIPNLSKLDGVVMVERYGELVFFGDIQTPAVKARNSTEYPIGAWNLGVSGKGVNIALTDTGVDNEHPGLSDKFVAGYDAVCFVHTDPQCILAGGREDDGSFDPDDGNQHGTACMGMASATGIEADGSQSDFYGSAPNSSLVDVRIGTDLGAGPFENYLIEQEFYESAMNGLQWIIDHKDDAWPGVGEENHGIDIISLSWGIISHENGGSDGSDMHSRILDEAMEAGVTVSNAAGNDGPDNDGLSGMSASSLSITVAATDDQNTVDRDDDVIASYSSRGPRRDNGNSNPLDELIPEVSAPGSNIIQAEGCVTDGGCNNFLGGDASQNTYTGRGSGTSYATPAVTGVIALIMEANQNLSPIQIKEVLKQTSERKGEPSAPELDPYWNRDFGYGMVDAHAAVLLAQMMEGRVDASSLDVTIQNHILSENYSSDLINITGHSWGQMGSVEMVEFRIDGGAWNEASYSSETTELGPLQPFFWHIILSSDDFGKGSHELEIRASSGGQHSLPSYATFNGTENAPSEFGVPLSAVALVIFVFIAWCSSVLIVRFRTDEQISDAITRLSTKPGDIIEAEIVED